MLARGERVPPLPTYIIPFVFSFFGSFLSRCLKVKCYTPTTKLQMRKAYCIAFPQTARLPDSCALLSFPVISSSKGDTRRNSADSDTNWSLSPSGPQPFTFLPHYLESVFNRSLNFFVYSHLSSWLVPQTTVSRSKRAFVQSSTESLVLQLKINNNKKKKESASRLLLDLLICSFAKS